MHIVFVQIAQLLLKEIKWTGIDILFFMYFTFTFVSITIVKRTCYILCR